MTPAPVRVAVVGGGQNCEHTVSLASSAAVADALESVGHDVVRVTVDTDGGWLVAGDDPVAFTDAVRVLGGCDAVVPVLHGPRGEDGTMAAVCELAGVPYVGSGVTAGAVAMDKWVTRLVANDAGIATAPGTLLTLPTAAAYGWTRPVVVKPVRAGSSRGVSLVDEPSGMAKALDAAFALDTRVLVEHVVAGREVDVAVLGRPDGTRTVAPILEIVTEGSLFDFDAKYGSEPDFRIPAELSPTDREHLQGAAVAMFDALGCAGVAVNTMPGFTEHSQVPKMFAAAGLPYPELVDLLVRDVLPT